MHIHGYLWTGPRERFDDEGLRRPPYPDPPPTAAVGDTAAQRLVDRYREAVAEFPVTDLPPIETAHWLIKRPALIKDTWQEPKNAADWLGRRLAECAPRFASAHDRDTTRLAVLVSSASERLAWGGDVSHGFYLGQAQFLSLALVACSPNRAEPGLACPAE
ncbi:hypothetical protein ACWEFL_26460 [Streptomyces sp. NPDC004838]